MDPNHSVYKHVDYVNDYRISWSFLWSTPDQKTSEALIFTGTYLSKLFIVGNSSTSLVAGWSVSSITSLSDAVSTPPVGGIPIERGIEKVPVSYGLPHRHLLLKVLPVP